jgi:DNA invertase Pin-like site-specific DNA recombinase
VAGRPVAGCAKVYAEKASGAVTDREALAKVLRLLKEGDTLIVTRLDRLARSTRDLLNTLDWISPAATAVRFFVKVDAYLIACL